MLLAYEIYNTSITVSNGLNVWTEVMQDLMGPELVCTQPNVVSVMHFQDESPHAVWLWRKILSTKHSYVLRTSQ